MTRRPDGSRTAERRFAITGVPGAEIAGLRRRLKGPPMEAKCEAPAADPEAGSTPVAAAERGSGRVPPRRRSPEPREARHADPGAATEPGLTGQDFPHVKPPRSSDLHATRRDRALFNRIGAKPNVGALTAARGSACLRRAQRRARVHRLHRPSNHDTPSSGAPPCLAADPRALCDATSGKGV